MTNVSVIKNPNNELTAPRSFEGKQLSLIRRTVAKDTTSEEFDMFIEICKRQGLDPFRRQIYALVYNKDDDKKRQVAFITGIDGYRAIAKRSGNYRPDGEEPLIEFDETMKCDTNPQGIKSATVKVYQYAIDGWYPITGKAMWDEFAPVIEKTEWVEVRDKNGNPVLQTEGQWKGRPLRERIPTGEKYLNNGNWVKMPHIMLAKCAEAQALRKGWPEEIGGLYTHEEMHLVEAESIASEEIAKYEEEKRMIAVNAFDSYPMILEMSEGLQMIKEGEFCDKILGFLSTFENAQQIDFWREQNRVGLQQYWAKCPKDAMNLKKEIENIEKKLNEAAK
jgi:phage recombination protein Bet